MKKLKVDVYRSARYVGDDDTTFEPMKTYRGDFIRFDNGILFRYRSKVYQSGLANWEFRTPKVKTPYKELA